MQSNFYIHKLYPLQDRVLKFLQAAETSFYLTGGTALSRCYLHHRYSDDLDLFLNQSPVFSDEIKKVMNALESSELQYQMAPLQEFYARMMFFEGEVELKVEFVNDVNFHRGDFQSLELFHKVDNPHNILSNKVCALSRNAAKDVADLIFLSTNYSFRWDEIINDARRKDTWVNELDVANALLEFPIKKFSDVKFIKTPDEDFLSGSTKTIAKELLLGTANSLCTSK